MFTAIVSLHHRKIHTVYEMKQPYVRPQVMDWAKIMSSPHAAENQERKRKQKYLHTSYDFFF